jgi:hypothetical protein
VSIWNEAPVARMGTLALIALRARNRDVQNVSVIASGYVKDFTGAWVTSSVPAYHYKDVLSGAQNLDPLPDELRSDTSLTAWKNLCIANGWKCDAIIDDFRTQDVLTLLASCGYAKPYQSEVYGVTVDDDRSGDDPIQIFNRRNATNFRWERAFARVPDGLIVNCVDKDNDYKPAQIVVYRRDRSLAVPGLFETVSYDGLVETDAVRARAQYDLDQADLRSIFYYFDTDIEAIVCRRGSLIGVQHDVLTQQMGDGLIKKKILNGDNEIVAIELDSTIPISNEPDMHAVTDMHAIKDMHKVGLKTGIAIRRNDGTISTHQVADPTGESDVIHLADAIGDTDAIVAQANDPKRPSLVTSGKLGTVYRRHLVSGITPGKDFQASLTSVDEAPELVRLAA